jgi:hypothetical protein
MSQEPTIYTNNPAFIKSMDFQKLFYNLNSAPSISEVCKKDFSRDCDHFNENFSTANKSKKIKKCF